MNLLVPDHCLPFSHRRNNCVLQSAANHKLFKGLVCINNEDVTHAHRSQ